MRLLRPTRYVVNTLLLSCLILVACTATPRSAQPSAHPDAARSGAPWSHLPAAPHSHRPAVANVATSEGTDGPADSHAGGTAADVTLEGIASWVAPRYGKSYLAMRLPKGTHVTLSGPGGTWEAVVNDYGPAKRTGRIADIAVGRWEDITGLDRSLGLARITVVITKMAGPTLPPTDMEGR